MRWLRVAMARLRGLFRGGAVEQDIDEEMRCHIEMLAEANLQRGITGEEAYRQALKSFGNIGHIKDAARDVKGAGMLDILWQDLRYAVRMLLKKRGFTLVVVTVLALGIGANTAIFSVVNAVLLRPLPFADPERLIRLFYTTVQEPNLRAELSYPDFIDYKTRSQILEYAAGYLVSGLVISGGQDLEVVTGADVSADLFPLLGANAAVGRVFTAEEDQPGAPPVIVLGYEFWQSHFGGDSNVIGQTVKMSGNRTVIGVMPPGFKFPIQSEKPINYWAPLTAELGSRLMTRRDLIFLDVVGKFKPGVTIGQAQAELSNIASSLEAEYPASNADRQVSVVSAHEDLVGKVRPALLILFGAVGFVLLIACANVANLLLARASARGKEMAIRTALGATRTRIVRQLLVESTLLSILGGASGLLLATWGLSLLTAASPADLPRVDQIGLDKNVLGFSLLVSILTGILFGLTPALQASKVNLNEVMKEGTRGSSGGSGRKRMRSALVVCEVALSLVLVIGAGLLIKSFIRLVSTDPGFDPDRVLAMSLPLSNSKYPTPEQKGRFFQEVIKRVSELPGVEAAGVTTLLPIGGGDIVHSFNVEGRPPTAPGSEPTARYQVISPSYFEAMKMTLRRGRTFTEEDAASASQVIINEALARRYFPDEDPMGKRIILEGQAPREIIGVEIIGVVGDVLQRGLDEDVVPINYVSYLQAPEGQMNLVVRTTSKSPSESIPAIRGVIKEINKDQLIYQTRTLNDLVAKSLAPRRFNMFLLGVFAVVALVLAATGIFGVMSFNVAQRTHEIGIRMALGAHKKDIFRLVIGKGMLLTLIGIGIGLVAAFALTRLLTSLLFGVSATDPLVFGGIALLLAGVSFVACFIPANRATRVDPMLALRYE